MRTLEKVGAVIDRSRPNPIIVLGDFNVKSTAWSFPKMDPHGRALGGRARPPHSQQGADSYLRAADQGINCGHLVRVPQCRMQGERVTSLTGGDAVESPIHPIQRLRRGRDPPMPSLGQDTPTTPLALRRLN